MERNQLHLVGVAQLNGGRQLIGLEDTLGTRSFLLDLDAEAIYVLAELSHPHHPPPAQPRRLSAITRDHDATKEPDMTDEFTYTPEQALARSVLLTAVNGGINHWARAHGYTADCPPEQVHAEGVDTVYPEGWLESGGPIRTVRGQYGTRHVPDHTGFGGYDLCGDIREQVSRR